MTSNTAEQDAATELLIAQLIAADFGFSTMDHLPTSSSEAVEDHSTDNSTDPSPAPDDEGNMPSSEAEQAEGEAENLDQDSSAINHEERCGDDPDTGSLWPSEELDVRFALESPGGTPAPIDRSSCWDEPVWWTARESGKAREVEEVGLDEEGSEGQENGDEDAGGQEDAEDGWKDEDGYGDERDERSDEEEFEEEDSGWNEEDYERNGEDDHWFKEKNFDEMIGGVIWIPSPGEQRVGRRLVRSTRAKFETTVADVFVADDETLEDILAAMTL